MMLAYEDEKHFAVADPGYVERGGVVRSWDPSKGRVLDQGDVPPPAQSAEAFSNLRTYVTKG